MDSIKVIRSNRKTLAIEINKNAEVIVRAPFRASTVDIERFIVNNQDWTYSLKRTLKFLGYAQCNLFYLHCLSSLLSLL